MSAFDGGICPGYRSEEARLSSHNDNCTGIALALSIAVALVWIPAGIVRECRDVDDLCLTTSYREAFREDIEWLRDESVQRERLAASLSVPPEDIQFDESGTRLDVFVEDVRAGGWRSKAAFVADLASEHLLSEQLGDRWERLPATERTQLLVALRSFVETCPVCRGTVTPDEDVVRSCCRDDIVSVTTACEDCGAVVFKGTEA